MDREPVGHLGVQIAIYPANPAATMMAGFRVKIGLITALAPAAILAGCASMSTNRVFEVTAARLDGDAPRNRGIVAAHAVGLFRDLTTQLNYEVRGPIQVNRTSVEYYAAPRSRSPMGFTLTLWIEPQRVDFCGGLIGTEAELMAAQKAADWYRQSLDKEGIEYRVATRASFFWGP